MEKTDSIINVYAESTPNPNAVKFVLNKMLVPNDIVEFRFGSQAKNAPLVSDLFNMPFVVSVFISNNFITITKTEQTDWHEIIPVLRDFIGDYFRSGKELFTQTITTHKGEIVEQIPEEPNVLTNELDIKISNILDEYIKPAVESDGGAISFKSFKNGVVTVKMQGSCSGCPSSTMTLKAGIEGLLKRLVPEVESVVAE
jgi:Fe-S cluster biogenesis protein NfuA